MLEAICRVAAALALLFLDWPWQLLAVMAGIGLIMLATLRQRQSKITE